MNRCACLLVSIFLTMSAGAALLGCDPLGQQRPPKADAVAVLIPTDGNTASGTVTFSKVEGGVRVIATVKGLSPGDHGLHIHEFGDCRSGDGSFAGDHFNPDNQPHGAPDAQTRHMGDMGNVTAGQDGTAALDLTDALLTLEGENSIVGRSVLVHADPDDLATQPHGASGVRLACGVIGVARP